MTIVGTSDAENQVADLARIEPIEEGPALPSLLTEDYVGKFEKGIQVYKRFQAACFRLTHESDWINQGKSFCLQSSGAEKLMNPLGINCEKPHLYRDDKVDDAGSPYYIYWCEGFVESKALGRRGWYVGCCDSKDQFFNARPKWNPFTGEGDVKKAAYSNWIVNAVTRIAGVRNPCPEILAAAGLNPDKIGKIDYSAKSKTLESQGDVISEAQAKRLYAIAKGSGISDDDLRTKVKEVAGVDHTREIQRKHYEALCTWAEGKE